ncbi:hypothetical protein HUB98_24210 [Paenibacillus barcinonensis]|uniref:Uncharacterized protein n=1 Tax=Paenibacillus barcinonensis TaxID=198119 RepID=A0ABX6Q9W5_PAEBA|nr:hypothetical protein [Paenibacillus barcinonensis]QKS59001.1 hypothetical protein HUB98_24180 [Paenibacillus barcinonensis]QKS59005.1 hypothetical protein HUB98_24210 [Paenibacillus barcinonensis]
MMEKLLIKGEGRERLQIILKEIVGFPQATSHFGGYDVVGRVEIASGNYYVNGELWLTTGELYLLYKDLRKAYQECKGLVSYRNYEGNLEFNIGFMKLGQVEISGRYQERHDRANELIFNFCTDQSYLQETVEGLEGIHKKYGDMKGNK